MKEPRMKVDLVHAPRRFLIPGWAVLLVLLWFALGGLVISVAGHCGRPVQLCLFRHVTGLCCPTCGFTRGVLSLLHGQPIRAWLHNPLLFSGLTFWGAAGVVRLLGGRQVRLDLTTTERRTAWGAAAILLALNWIYVILYVG